jgi:hypothetical protein
MKNDNMRWMLLAIGVVIVLGMQQTLPKEVMQKLALNETAGMACTDDSDCPCWGTYEVGGADISAYGIGTSRCIDNVCDITYCLDVQPFGEWARDNPWEWLRTNPLATVGLAGLLLLVIFWPKQ